MTKRDVFVEKDVVMNTMMWIATWNGIIPAPAILKVTARSFKYCNIVHLTYLHDSSFFIPSNLVTKIKLLENFAKLKCALYSASTSNKGAFLKL